MSQKRRFLPTKQLALGILFLACISANDALPQTVDSTTTTQTSQSANEEILTLSTTTTEIRTMFDALRNIKISGYVQSQFQQAEGAGISSYSGGNFPENVKSRFQVRRGRLKIGYTGNLSQYVLQIDVSQNGVGIKDAYAMIREPWWKALSLTAGVFDRPFGFEISYSSGAREAPERTRMFQTLFPGERELGAKIELAAEEGWLSYFNLKAGLFNGVLSTSNENNGFKDFIGRAGFRLPFDDVGLDVDAGISLYSGKVTNNSPYVYSMDLVAPTRSFLADSLPSNVGGGYGRGYLGFDAQLDYELPVLGKLSLRGEYIHGQQPGTATSNSFYNPDAAGPTGTKSPVDGRTLTPLYLRTFTGWYAAYIQSVGLRNQFVFRYDVFDPNTDAEGAGIGASGTSLSAADIRYATLGLGWIFHWDSNVKFVVYYDLVTNEKVNAQATGPLAPFVKDIKDNVLTVRMQYKF